LDRARRLLPPALALVLLVLSLAPLASASGFPTTLNLASSSSCVTISSPFVLTATLRNNTNQAALPGKVVIFQYAVNASSFGTLGNTSGYTTDANGQAHLSFAAKYNGSYLFRTVFGGSSDFFNPANDFNGSISNKVLVQTSNACSGTAGSGNCGFLGSGCLGQAISNAFSSLGSGISGFFSQIGFWLNPLNWLNALGLGFVWNAFLNFIDILLIFFQLVVATLPYLGFIILMINLFYVVQFDFEGLFAFWTSVYSIVSVVADAIFNFVQIIVDLVQAVGGGSGGVGAAAAAA
jgi:hypothetical protein